MTSFSSITTWIFFASCKSVAIIIAVLLCRRLLSRWLTPQGRYVLWFAVIACLLVPYGARVDFRVLQHASALQVESVSADESPTPRMPETIADSDAFSTTIASNVEIVRPTPSSQHSEQTHSTTSLLVLLWLGGVLALLFVIVRNQWRYRRIKTSAESVNAGIVALFSECQLQSGVSRVVLLRETAQINSPTMFGWRAATLLIPLGLARQVTTDQLRYVFLHELAHVRRHDVLVNWIATIAQVMHWFNPLVWYAFYLLRADMEQACDAHAIRRLSAREQTEYGNTLIKLSDLSPGSMFMAQGVGVVEGHSQLKARIKMIAQFRPSTLRQSLLGVFVLLTMTSIAVTQADTRAANAVKTDVVNANATLPNSPNSPNFPNVPNAPNAKHSAASPHTEDAPMRGTPADALLPINDSSKSTKRPNAKNEALRAEYLQINYVNANDLVSLIRPGSGIALLSDRGRVAADPRTNTLLVNDTDERLAAVRQLVTTLDVPLRQILIDAHVALVDSDFSQELFAKAKGNSVAVFGADFNAATELHAAQEQHRGEIVSAPRLITDNRKEAMFQEGIEIPNQAAPSAKVALSVRTRSNIAPDNRIHLYLSVGRDTTAKVAANSNAADAGKDSTRLNTDVLLNDGQTVVLRDIFQTGGSSQTNGAANGGAKKELLVFLKTKIVPEEASRNF